MNPRLVDRLIAAGVFVFALVLYLLTVAPTASFWDAGEFIAIAHGLQVSHPPGAPFYMLVGRLFSMFLPSAYVALGVNMVSVVASAATVLFTHLIIVRLVRLMQGPETSSSSSERFVALAGGALGALAFAATDSFWFNAVEAEVYASSMLFTTAVVWLVLKWEEAAHTEDRLKPDGHGFFGLASNRYLILIAYLFGLAIGVHLLNLLAIFFISLIIFFAAFDRAEWTNGRRWMGIVGAAAASSIAFLVVYPGIVQMLPELAEKIQAPIALLLGLVVLIVYAIYYTQKHRMAGLNLVFLCLTAVLIGYSTYALIFVRSASDPPIDENDPETTEAIVSYLKREQYGQTPLLRGFTYNNAIGNVDMQNEVMFPRRHDSAQIRTYARYDSDWDFFWSYQVGHMYVRYFLWNFVGRAADTQDAPAITGLIPGEGDAYLQRTPSEKASRNAYYGIPLLIGLIGCAFHFTRDWKRAFSVLVLFFITGLGIIIYLNQPPNQPRERDYSYVASFFAFSLWIGIGVSGILQLALEALRGRKLLPSRELVALGVAAALLFVALPLNLAVVNFADHDRSGNYAAPDYAFNMLNSVEEHGIIFTNGDNDTFPLWYLQEIEGERTDVRVVNLSLLNTPWYINQLKKQQAHESEPLPISIPDEQIPTIAPTLFQPRAIELPVDPRLRVSGTETTLSMDSVGQATGDLTWQFNGRPYNAEYHWLHVADQVAADIVMTNARQGWKRPVYFAVTVSSDGQLDLQPFFQLEGQAFRVIPAKHDMEMGRVHPDVTYRNLMRFRFRELDNPDVYYDENARRMIDNYRGIYALAAEQLAQTGHQDKARNLLNKISTEIPFSTIAGDERSYLYLARAYSALGDLKKVSETWARAEELVLHRVKHASTQQEMQYMAQFALLIRDAYMDIDDFDAAATFSNRLADVTHDDSMRVTPDRLRRMAEEVRARQDSTRR